MAPADILEVLANQSPALEIVAAHQGIVCRIDHAAPDDNPIGRIAKRTQPFSPPRLTDHDQAIRFARHQ